MHDTAEYTDEKEIVDQKAIELAEDFSYDGFSLLIFFSVGTYVMYMAAMKQCFAMFFLLLSIPYCQLRN